jgi:hypothetical protein
LELVARCRLVLRAFFLHLVRSAYASSALSALNSGKALIGRRGPALGASEMERGEHAMVLQRLKAFLGPLLR